MSTIKVNTIENRTGSTLTLGKSGTTIQMACGATQTGFGRTGTVNWCTTAKTSPLTVASGNGYFINTTSGSITVTLPSSPSQGDIVAFKDYANTWDTSPVTVGRNGSKINGFCACATLTTESQSVTLIYVDGVKGWQDIHDSTSDVTGKSYIAATGGSVVTSGNYKIHTFTSSGCFQVTAVGNPAGSDLVSYAVVAGGGGGGKDRAGGGGAGGFREGKAPAFETYTASPLAAPGLPVSVQTYPITVGAGGAGVTTAPAGQQGGKGNNSIFSTITSTGGGGAGSGPSPFSNGEPGGSGGGGDSYGTPGGSVGSGGTGNTPPVSPPQGNAGGAGRPNSPNTTGRGGGGGGATAAGAGGQPAGNPGGAGATTEITGSPVGYAGGGGGSDCGSGTPTGTQGGGDGGSACAAAQSGTANTGGGGGGGNGGVSGNCNGGSGGSGVVIIRYKFQN